VLWWSAAGERATTRSTSVVTAACSHAATPAGMGRPGQFSLVGWASLVWPWAEFGLLDD
jgi:hypothetical protein